MSGWRCEPALESEKKKRESGNNKKDRKIRKDGRCIERKMETNTEEKKYGGSDRRKKGVVTEM